MNEPNAANSSGILNAGIAELEQMIAAAATFGKSTCIAPLSRVVCSQYVCVYNRDII